MKAAALHPAPAPSRKAAIQYGALPYRVVGDGLELLLITSRRSRRWIVPKGWPIEGLEPYASAAREAFEEAGVEGEVAQAPLGSFNYVKELRRGAVTVPCRVVVYALGVTHQRRSWPEKQAREYCWVPLEQAATMVDEPQLKRLIVRFGAQQSAEV